MNYRKIYDSLIERSRTRLPLTGYVERHHITPRCLGGSNDSCNIAILTPEEHFVAHILLVKLYPDNLGLITAVSRMCNGRGRRNRKLYGWLKRKHSKLHSENTKGRMNPNYHMTFITDGNSVARVKVDAVIPPGWVRGKVCHHCRGCGAVVNKHSAWCVSCRNSYRPSERPHDQLSIKQMQLQLGDWYRLYNKFGWRRFVELTGYDKTQENFVAICARHLLEFVPQNGRVRGAQV